MFYERYMLQLPICCIKWQIIIPHLTLKGVEIEIQLLPGQQPYGYQEGASPLVKVYFGVNVNFN